MIHKDRLDFGFHMVLASTNAIIALALITTGLWGLITAIRTPDRYEAAFVIAGGAWLAFISIGLILRNKLIVTIGSVPVIITAGAFLFILSFAPFAWGESNMGTIYFLVGANILLIALHMAGVITVFSINRKKHINVA